MPWDLEFVGIFDFTIFNMVALLFSTFGLDILTNIHVPLADFLRRFMMCFVCSVSSIDWRAGRIVGFMVPFFFLFSFFLFSVAGRAAV